MMRVGAFLIALMAPFAATAQVAAVTQIHSSSLVVYTDHKGSAKIAKLATKDLKLPAAQLSRASDYGLIMVEFRFRDAGKKPVLGWIRRRSVDVDERLKVDVVSPCAKSLASKTSVTRGTRGLGDRC